MDEQNAFLGRKRIGSLLFKFAVPCVASLLISALYNVVDQLFIGNSEIGFLGNKATTIVFPLTILALALSLWIGDGTASFMALAQGKKETKGLGFSVRASLIIGMVVALLFTLFSLVFIKEILTFLGASGETYELSYQYGLIVLAGIPAYFFLNILNPIIRSDGSPLLAMIAQCSGAVINIILDPIFIFVFKLGIQGAAYATIIGQVVSGLISLMYLFRSKTFHLSLKSLASGFSDLPKMLAFGFSSFLLQMSIVLVTVVSDMVLIKVGATSEYGSDIPVAVFGIAFKVFTIVVNIPLGIALGGVPIIGYNQGAGNIKRVKKTIAIILWWTLGISLAFTLLFEIFPLPVIRLFGSESETYEKFAVLTFRIYLSCLILTSLMRVLSVLFQALGKPVLGTFVSLLRDLCLLLPLTALLPSLLGINGFFYSAPISDLVSFFVVGIISLLALKKLFAKPKECEKEDNPNLEMIKPS